MFVCCSNCEPKTRCLLIISGKTTPGCAGSDRVQLLPCGCSSLRTQRRTEICLVQAPFVGLDQPHPALVVMDCTLAAQPVPSYWWPCTGKLVCRDWAKYLILPILLYFCSSNQQVTALFRRALLMLESFAHFSLFFVFSHFSSSLEGSSTVSLTHRWWMMF